MTKALHVIDTTTLQETRHQRQQHTAPDPTTLSAVA